MTATQEPPMTRREIIDYCLTLPGAYEDYPFNEVVDETATTVMRHSGNTKSFALIMRHGNALYLNLKCDPFEADMLRQIYTDVIPGYHMNKRHWNTIIVGGDVPAPVIRQMIDVSYDLIRPRKRRKPCTE